jgi:uncharacterized OB-fold protein
MDAGLFASLDPPCLAGSRCQECGTVVFPTASSCPRCSSKDLTTHALPSRGEVWTWTVQGFQPKAPYVVPAGGFTPFGVGYVDLGDLLVEGHLLVDPEHLRIGLPVRLTLEPVTEPGGGTRVTYAFEIDEDAT